MKDSMKKLKYLAALQDIISKKTPRDMSEYFQQFEGTDQLSPDGLKDADDEEKQIKKLKNSHKKKSKT